MLAILLSIGIPSFQSLVAQNRATSAANELQSTLQFARSTAIAQARPVTVCAATNFTGGTPTCITGTTAVNWNGGWIVLQGGQVLRERRALHPSIIITGAPSWVYSTTGTLLNQAVGDFQAGLVVNVGQGDTRRVCMVRSGSSRIERPGGTQCPA
ncbi:MAG: GspH/FimT family pseudopilin [Betaproteobacteria bacterium]|nr:GspH/FimT family pseudopilin [Betaproteobacteria bacterium]